MKNAPVALDGLATEQVPGGTLYHLPNDEYYATPDNGWSRVFRREGKSHVKTMRRNAENFLRRTAGMSMLPRFCAFCGTEVDRGRNDAYCGAACRSKRGKGRTTAESFEWDALTEAERAAKLATVRAAHDLRVSKGDTAHKLMKWEVPTMPDANGCMFRDGVALADAIIQRRGGEPRPLPSYEQYVSEYQAAQVPQGETA